MLGIVSRVVLISSVVMSLGLPCRVGLAQSLPELRTPKAPPTPRIHGAKLYGARPGHPFLYRIPSTGLRPVHFSAVGLPPSLKIDGATGIISGNAPPTAGECPVTLKAVNSRGSATRSFKIVVGDQLGLTPQMGWNGWYTLYARPRIPTFVRPRTLILGVVRRDSDYFVPLSTAENRAWCGVPRVSEKLSG
jgi:hypothetical protein